MKRTPLFFTALLTSVSLFGQGFSTRWKTSPFENKAFIENHGQFNDAMKDPASPVLYGVNNLGAQIYFSAKGLSYRFDEVKPREERRGRREETEFETTSFYVNMEWVGANPSVVVSAVEKLGHHYSYEGKDGKGINNVPAYSKIIYKNLYPGIDVEYIFHPKEGIKYNLVVRPGADVTKVKMRYSGAVSEDERGNIHLKTPFGDIIDHAPVSYYQNGSPLVSSFDLNGNTVSFVLPSSIDHPGSPIIIDPWLTNPGFTTLNRGYDLNVYTNGDVYVLGGGTGTGGGGGYQLKKFNSAGALQWTYTPTANGWYGDMDIDNAGDAYLSTGTGSTLTKVSAAGALVYTKNIPGVSEPWRNRMNCNNNRFYYGGGGTNVSSTLYSFVEVDANLGTVVNQGNSMTGSLNTKEARALEIDPSNGDVYGIIISPLQNSNAATNRMVRMSANLTVIYDVQSGFMENEYGFAYTNTSGLQGFNGFNGIAIDANSANFYSYDGLLIIKRDKATGTQIASKTVTGGIFDKNSGICNDRFGNVYVGTQDSIKQYDCNLNYISGISTGTPVYDLCPGLKKNEILACGDGFVASYTFNVALGAPTTPSTGCSSNCNGTARVVPCDTLSAFNYLWSNGQSTRVATGLCPATYTVYVGTKLHCQNYVDTLTATVTGGSGGGATVNTASTGTILCNGGSTGSATATVSGGKQPYTYLWSNGQSTINATGLSAGTYTLTVTDSAGCVSTKTVAINQPTALVITGSGSTICEGQSTSISAIANGGTGNITYSWNPGGQTTSSITVSPTVTTNYTVTATDANGCTKTQVVTVTVNPRPIASFTANPTTGQPPLLVTFTNTSTGGSTYSWAFGDGGSSTSQNTSHTYVTNGNYTVTLVVTSNAGCKDSITMTINVFSESLIIVPNVFSPNGDGYNDLFTINSVGLKELYVQIYDRWGLKMGEFNTVIGGWDGKAASGKDAPEGTYYYILKATGEDEQTYDMAGYLMLLRK